jgi:hypothetical protein
VEVNLLEENKELLQEQQLDASLTSEIIEEQSQTGFEETEEEKVNEMA